MQHSSHIRALLFGLAMYFGGNAGADALASAAAGETGWSSDTHWWPVITFIVFFTPVSAGVLGAYSARSSRIVLAAMVGFLGATALTIWRVVVLQVPLGLGEGLFFVALATMLAWFGGVVGAHLASKPGR